MLHVITVRSTFCIFTFRASWHETPEYTGASVFGCALARSRVGLRSRPRSTLFEAAHLSLREHHQRRFHNQSSSQLTYLRITGFTVCLFSAWPSASLRHWALDLPPRAYRMHARSLANSVQFRSHKAHTATRGKPTKLLLSRTERTTITHCHTSIDRPCTI